MRVREEFSRYASVYGESNIIQTKVAQKLINDRSNNPSRIIDLGCGSGTLYSLIDWPVEKFIGVDFSPTMLEYHPKSDNVQLMLGDFNDPMLFERLKTEQCEHIYSASALQWAENLLHVFQHINTLQIPFSFALFTSGTFKTLYECASLPPLLKTSDEIIEIAKASFDVRCEIVQYTLEFDSVREMFRYIKRSGVSGGRRVLSYSQTKQLMESYPLNYLEFEVVFISKS